MQTRASCYGGRTASWVMALAIAALSVGCSKPQHVGVWSMPVLQQRPLDPAAQPHGPAHPTGLPWSLPHPNGPDAIASSVTSEDAVRGDLPDSALTPALGLWRSDESRAWREARDTGRGVLVEFAAEWCMPCRLLETKTFNDEQVRAAMAADFVPLRIDVTEETMLGREQLERYKVVGLPAILVLDSEGKEIDRISHFVDATTLLRRLKAARAKL